MPTVADVEPIQEILQSIEPGAPLVHGALTCNLMMVLRTPRFSVSDGTGEARIDRTRAHAGIAVRRLAG